MPSLICLFAPLTDLVPAEVAEAVEEAKRQMSEGTLAPFSGEIYYANGEQLCAEGQTLDRGEIWSIYDVIRGVNATSN
jgi:hypothetical protein